MYELFIDGEFMRSFEYLGELLDHLHSLIEESDLLPDDDGRFNWSNITISNSGDFKYVKV